MRFPPGEHRSQHPANLNSGKFGGARRPELLHKDQLLRFFYSPHSITFQEMPTSNIKKW